MSFCSLQKKNPKKQGGVLWDFSSEREEHTENVHLQEIPKERWEESAKGCKEWDTYLEDVSCCCSVQYFIVTMYM